MSRFRDRDALNRAVKKVRRGEPGLSSAAVSGALRNELARRRWIRTVRAIRKAGFVVDRPHWRAWRDLERSR